jgi:hypothetical protein
VLVGGIVVGAGIALAVALSLGLFDAPPPAPRRPVAVIPPRVLPQPAPPAITVRDAAIDVSHDVATDASLDAATAMVDAGVAGDGPQGVSAEAQEPTQEGGRRHRRHHRRHHRRPE